MQKGFANYILVLIVVGIVTVAVGVLVWKNNSVLPIPGGQKACTLEAKICPDGSGVGRSGPNCEFAACPSFDPKDTSHWQTYTDPNSRYSFQHPVMDPSFIETTPSTVTVGCGCELFTWFSLEFVSTPSKPLDWWNNVGKQLYKDKLVNAKTTTVQVNGSDVIKIDAQTPLLKATPASPAIPLGGVPFRIYAFQAKNGLAVVSQNFVSEDQDLEFEEILKSFKFN